MSKKQTRNKLFTFVVNDDEKEEIDELAEKLKRSKGDAVRRVVSDAVEGIRNFEQDTEAA
jgi:predicted transcriptional regulator